MKIDDFVIVSLTADKPKYGIIAGFESEHRIKVLLLTRRYKNGSGQVGHQIIDVNNIVQTLIYLITYQTHLMAWTSGQYLITNQTHLMASD